MLRMSVQQIESISCAYKQLAKVPAVLGARLTASGNRVAAKWSVRNLDRGQTTKFSHQYTVDDKFNVIAESDFGTDVTNELLSSVSPSERYRAVIRDSGDAKEKKQFLEVWSAHSLAHSVDLKALDLHGDVYGDSEFKTLEWSPCEKFIVYVAEKKPAKSEPFIKRKSTKEKDNSQDNAVSQGEEHVYRQDWGEQLVGKFMSVIAVFRLEDESVTILTGLPESYCPGQVRWSADGNSLVGVAWETEPRRLGLIFCTNRPSYIFSLTLDGNYRQISSNGKSVRSPRFVGDKLVWLERSVGGPHHCCHTIVAAGWPLKDNLEIEMILDVVDDETKTANNTSFHGVYCQALPSRLHATSDRLVFSTQQKTTINSYVLHMDTKQLYDISDKTFKGSLTILDVQDDVIVAFRSSFSHPNQLVMSKLPPKGKEDDIKWVPISKLYDVPPVIGKASVDYLYIEHSNEDSFRKFCAIYLTPGDSKGHKLPLIVHIHGGPHTNYVDSYSFEVALFLSLGFAVILINYRGSTGAGQKGVEYVMHRIGSADVTDCKIAVEEAVKRHPVDTRNMFLFGGSHGGFLVCGLSGQYPDMFNSVSARNPVTEIVSMFNSTDIPDWCAIEVGYDFTERGPLSEEMMLKMRRVSPMAHAHKVRAPTALMLGSVDKRVPFYQGLEYYHRLKANGCVTQLFMYDDNHSLSSIPVEMDSLINSILWFKKHAKQD